VILSLAPSAPQLLLVGVRDEMLDRSWQPPARHWPELSLVGGLDELAGGTWLAVDPAIPRVACVLNGRGQAAPQPFRKSRGELPLLAGAGGRPAIDRLDCAAYDPFHLIVAEIASAQMLSWDGVRTARTGFGPGTHVITNTGLDPEDPKAAYFTGKFAGSRPAADPTAEPDQAWGNWRTLAAGDGLPETDPRAIRVRHQLSNGRIYGTGSVSYVAFGAAGLRYDFEPVPGQISAVSTGLVPPCTASRPRGGRGSHMPTRCRYGPSGRPCARGSRSGRR
jgi:hypothetical protein